MLFFYPRDFIRVRGRVGAFVCPTELRAFAELHAEFAAAGARVVAVSTDSYWSHRACGSGDDRPYLRCLPNTAASRRSPACATRCSPTRRSRSPTPTACSRPTALRCATFVIDPQGTIRHGSVSDQAIGRSPAETLRVVQALQTGELCPVDWRPGTPTLRLAA